MTTDVLIVESQVDGVAVLEMNRPDKRNALNAELRQAFIDSLAELAVDDGVKAVVLTGRGSTFCAGFDLEELATAPRTEDVFAHATTYHHAVHTFTKPVVAAIEGAAVAGGMDLALMCDLRVAATGSKLGQPQVKMGVPAAYDLVRTVVAEPVARELCLTGRIITSAEATEIGLIHKTVEPGTTRDEAMSWAQEIAAVPGAIAMKQAFISAQPPLFAPD